MATRKDVPIFTPEEMYFFAKDELITIVPNFSLPTENGTVHCISGEFGPFRPREPLQVPLWMALSLWKRKKCTVLPPAWMDPDSLEDVLEQERRDPTQFQPLPLRYIEVAHFLFSSDSEDALPQAVFGAERAARVRDVVDRVRRARYAKVLAGLATLPGALVVRLNNLSAGEVNIVRQFFLGSLDLFYSLEGMQGEGRAAVTASQALSQASSAGGASQSQGASAAGSHAPSTRED